MSRGTVESNHIGVRSCGGRVDTDTGMVERDFIRVVALEVVVVWGLVVGPLDRKYGTKERTPSLELELKTWDGDLSMDPGALLAAAQLRVHQFSR